MKNLLSALGIPLLLAACAAGPTVPDEPLVERYWRVIAIDGQSLSAASNRAEPHIVLTAALRTHGSDGCNRFHGSYDTAAGLKFGQMASTMMACPPLLDALARQFSAAIGATADYRIAGRIMELLDARGKVRLRLEATALK